MNKVCYVILLILYSQFFYGILIFFLWSDPSHKPIDDFTTNDMRELMNLNLVSYFAASKVRASLTLLFSLLQRSSMLIMHTES